jgi:hypothetical protein
MDSPSSGPGPGPPGRALSHWLHRLPEYRDRERGQSTVWPGTARPVTVIGRPGPPVTVPAPAQVPNRAELRPDLDARCSAAGRRRHSHSSSGAAAALAAAQPGGAGPGCVISGPGQLDLKQR